MKDSKSYLLTASSRYLDMTDSSLSPTEHRYPLRPWFHDRWRLLSLPLLTFIALPFLALILRASPEQIVQHLNDPQVLLAARVSLQTTAVSVVIILIFGTPISYSLSHSQSTYHRIVDTLVDLPTVLPPAVAGVALLTTFGRRGLFGPLLDQVNLQPAFTQVAVVMAQVFVAAPFYIKAAAIGFSSIDPEIEQAASLDGAKPGEAFRFIVLPLSWQALVSGIVMSWARAIGEFGATLIFAGNFPGRTQTMPIAIYMGFELDLEVALTLSVILLMFSFIVLLLVKWLLYREERE